MSLYTMLLPECNTENIDSNDQKHPSNIKFFYKPGNIEMICLLPKPEVLAVSGSGRKSAATQRNRFCIQDMNLKITWWMHFKTRWIFNITPSGHCCTSYTIALLYLNAPVLNLQENSYPNPKEKSFSIKPEANPWSIKPPSMHSLWIKIKTDIPSKASIFCSDTKCRRFIIQTSQGFV